MLRSRGISEQSAADRAGRSRPVARRAISGERPITVNFVELQGPAVARDFYQRRLAQLEVHASNDPPERLYMRIQAAAGTLATELDVALADGELDDLERVKLQRLTSDAIERLMQLQARLR